MRTHAVARHHALVVWPRGWRIRSALGNACDGRPAGASTPLGGLSCPVSQAPKTVTRGGERTLHRRPSRGSGNPLAIPLLVMFLPPDRVLKSRKRFAIRQTVRVVPLRQTPKVDSRLRGNDGEWIPASRFPSPREQAAREQAARE